eukprot:GHUV01038431.1.p1 GENE.GHUV01038431.1~~GHUV01038431.1.p1  ORF type:complete len:198 (+),score=32.84 GHUV01038431.1:838-1431(+)
MWRESCIPSQPPTRHGSCCSELAVWVVWSRLSKCVVAVHHAGVPNQPHIVEFHGLNRGVKTNHLDDFLLDYMWGDTKANIKWVDDEHALAVFPCAEAAQQLLQSTQTKYKVRPYSKASGGALQIAAEGGHCSRYLRKWCTAHLHDTEYLAAARYTGLFCPAFSTVCPLHCRKGAITRDHVSSVSFAEHCVQRSSPCC